MDFRFISQICTIRPSDTILEVIHCLWDVDSRDLHIALRALLVSRFFFYILLSPNCNSLCKHRAELHAATIAKLAWLIITIIIAIIINDHNNNYRECHEGLGAPLCVCWHAYGLTRDTEMLITVKLITYLVNFICCWRWPSTSLPKWARPFVLTV